MSALKKHKADGTGTNQDDARVLEALARQLLDRTADRTEVHSKALGMLLRLGGGANDGAAATLEKRLREAEATAEHLAAVLSEQRDLEDMLVALSATAAPAPKTAVAVPAAAASEAAGDILDQLLESRALSGKIAELKQLKAATQQSVSDVHAVLQQWNASVPTFVTESAQLSKSVKMVPLGPETEDAILAELLPSALFVLYRMLVVHRTTYGLDDGRLSVAVVQRDGLPTGVHPVTLDVSSGNGATVALAFAPSWGFVVAHSPDAALLSRLATSDDTGKRFPSQDTAYRLLLLQQQQQNQQQQQQQQQQEVTPESNVRVSEASVLDALAPWRPYAWCQSLCGLRSFLPRTDERNPHLTVDAFVRRLDEQ